MSEVSNETDRELYQQRHSHLAVDFIVGHGGVIAFLNIGRLEDPAFTIKTAVVVTRYDGASAQQVEEEVTLPLENAIQQLPYIDNISSISSVGLSQITINIKAQYGPDDLPQIWDVLRRELVVVPGVGKVAIVGVLPEELQIEISRAQMTAANIVPQRLYDLLSRQNVVSNAGELLVGSESICLHPTASLFKILCKCLSSEVTVKAVTELDNKATHCHTPSL